MPLYEYHCEHCDYSFEILIRSTRDQANCPRCGGDHVEKQLSIPAAAQTGHSRSRDLPIRGDTSAGSSFGCGRPQCGSGTCAGFD
jgi:putative FmdB family regulatory protein